MVELCGARLVPGTIDEAADVPEAASAGSAPSGSRSCSACRSRPSSASDYLERLDFEVERDGDDLEVTVPVHRHYDVTREVDLIEEVGRIHGYADNLPVDAASARAARPAGSPGSSGCAAGPRT